MKSINAILVYTFISFLALPLFAQETPYFYKATMKSGPLVGHRLDTKHIRGLVYEGDMKGHPGYMRIVNVNHDGKFYVAKVPVNGVNSVSFIYEKFTDMAGGHGSNVFHFDPITPVELIEEIIENSSGTRFIKLEKPIILMDLLISAEAVKTMSTKSGLVEGGLTNQFAMAYRLTSPPERLFPTVIGEKRQTTVIEIPFTQDQASNAFMYSILEWNDRRMNTNYNLASNNCISSALEGLAFGLTYDELQFVKRKMKRAIIQLNRLHTEDVTDAQIKRAFESFVMVLDQSGYKVRSGPIQDYKFYTDWLAYANERGIDACSLLFK